MTSRSDVDGCHDFVLSRASVLLSFQLVQQARYGGFPIPYTTLFLSCRSHVRGQLGGSGGDVPRSDLLKPA
jgi:hypothetical protein